MKLKYKQFISKSHVDTVTGEIKEPSALEQAMTETTIKMYVSRKNVKGVKPVHDLTPEDISKMNMVTACTATASMAIGITTGAVIGKTVGTAIILGAATAIAVDMAMPYKRMYNHVIKVK